MIEHRECSGENLGVSLNPPSGAAAPPRPPVAVRRDEKDVPDGKSRKGHA